jgi:hypothetical protein
VVAAAATTPARLAVRQSAVVRGSVVVVGAVGAAVTVIGLPPGWWTGLPGPRPLHERDRLGSTPVGQKSGGPEVAVELGTVAETPVPEEVTEVFQ